MRAVSRGCLDTPNAVDITAGISCFERSRFMPDGEGEVAVKHDVPVMARSVGKG